MAHLKKYLTFDHTTETQILLMQSMDTLGTVARAVGPTGFAPALAEECCKLGLDLIAKHDDPDVRKCAYGLFGCAYFIISIIFSILRNAITSNKLNICGL